ncbi:hypothetical protein HHI36_006772 [Cryptolaemus montrouzieri]|uniref:ZP domain-containing protein n=1 Tax=Cryptolaemus montrouzieri TaxID=559131 RepID=A0ABD2NY33_9CUCU
MYIHSFNIFTILSTIIAKTLSDELFQADLGNDFKIGLAENGYKAVKLKCGANHMTVTLETDVDFSGVLYTRGNFYDKKFPCFIDTTNSENKRNFSMKFSLRECNTKKETTDTLVFVENYVTSRIGLANADPAESSKEALPLIGTGSNTIVITPDTYKRKKDEL